MLKEQARLEKEIEALLAGAVSIDAEEDARYGADVRGDELPVELQRRQVRLAAIRAARERLKASQRARRRCARAQTRTEAQPEGRAALQKSLWRGPTRRLRATSRTPSHGS